jgi:hypothetical protein
VELKPEGKTRIMLQPSRFERSEYETPNLRYDDISYGNADPEDCSRREAKSREYVWSYFFSRSMYRITAARSITGTGICFYDNLKYRSQTGQNDFSIMANGGK